MMQKKAVRAAAIALCLAGYIWIGYFTARADFARLVLIYFLLFGLYLFVFFGRTFDNNIKIAIGAALMIRISLLFMTPNLSDDYFRFIWDGRLLASGHNPYLTTPAELLNRAPIIQGITAGLYAQLNSPHYYSAYPPMCQFIFTLSAKLSGGSLLGNIILIRVFILLAEFGTIILLDKIIKVLRQPRNWVILYAFNPLIIIELTGNLHFEAIMIFFLLLAVYLLIKERLAFSAISFGLAIGTKLIPVIFLPLLLKRLGLAKSLRYYAITAATVLLLFAPFFNIEAISNFVSSLTLYFRVFEFNASIYYAISWLGLRLDGGSLFFISRMLLPIFTFLIIIAVAVKERGAGGESLFRAMMLCLTVYLLLTTSVHPWNLAPLIMLSVPAGYRYVLPWSLLIILVYAAYQTVPYTENLWFVAIEYLLTGGWAVWEIFAHRASSHLERSV